MTTNSQSNIVILYSYVRDLMISVDPIKFRKTPNGSLKFRHLRCMQSWHGSVQASRHGSG